MCLYILLYIHLDICHIKVCIYLCVCKCIILYCVRRKCIQMNKFIFVCKSIYFINVHYNCNAHYAYECM